MPASDAPAASPLPPDLPPRRRDEDGTPPRRALRFALVVAASLAAAAVAECATRAIDGYSVASLRLVRLRPRPVASPATGKWLDPQQATFYVSRVPLAVGVDAAWFALDPEPRPPSPPDPELDRRYWAARGHELPSVYEWNLQFIRRVLCGRDPTLHPYLASQFRDLDSVYVFEPRDGAPYPTYRFLRAAHYPSGLTTNAFGWRGPDVPLNKPPGRVRIAFAGASTTLDAHADPFSYPEYVGRWLRTWAAARHPSVSFDVVNAGREGILSNSIAAVVREELLPVRPDLVVYYEGANQFWPNAFGARPVVQMFRVLNPSAGLGRYSAVAVRLHEWIDRPASGVEPHKPAIAVNWPPDLDERDPPLADSRLPVQLPSILGDLDRMRTDLASTAGTLMPSSFVWLVDPGMTLDAGRDALVYQELNDRYWPFSYAHLRRFVDFENRVFRKYARERALPFNDLDRWYPRDPRLFVDSIHMTPAGVKLKAWIVFQNLVPELDRRLRDGTLPIADAGGRAVHPAFANGSRRLESVAALAGRCGG
jgi:hypothetical protein